MPTTANAFEVSFPVTNNRIVEFEVGMVHSSPVKHGRTYGSPGRPGGVWMWGIDGAMAAGVLSRDSGDGSGSTLEEGELFLRQNGISSLSIRQDQ